MMVKETEKHEVLNTLFDKLDVVAKPTKKCEHCGREFNDGDIDYVTIQGNLYAGENGGLIGDNFPILAGTDPDADKFRQSEVRKSRFCLRCFIDILEDHKRRVADQLKTKIDYAQKAIQFLENGTTQEEPNE